MMTRYSAWLNGEALHEIDPAIYIMDIEESTPQIDTVTARRGAGDGMILLSRRRTGLQVNIRVMIHEYNTAKRKEIMQRIAEWATNGEFLTISDRPGQRLRVICTAPPVINSALKWTNTLNVGFAAYAFPYWEDETIKPVTLSGSRGNGVLTLGGTADNAPVEVAIQNTGTSEVNNITLTVGQTQFVLNNMNLAAGAYSHVTYDKNGLLRISKGTRTAESSDELIAACGAETAVSFVSDAPVMVAFRARGRYV